MIIFHHMTSTPFREAELVADKVWSLMMSPTRKKNPHKTEPVLRKRGWVTCNHISPIRRERLEKSSRAQRNTVFPTLV